MSRECGIGAGERGAGGQTSSPAELAASSSKSEAGQSVFSSDNLALLSTGHSLSHRQPVGGTVHRAHLVCYSAIST